MSSRRRRLRRTHHTSASSIALRIFAVASVVLVMVMVAVGVAGAMTVKSWLKDLPDYRAKGAFDVARPTRIFSADGKLLARLYLENREVVPISQISTDLVNGVVAIEDERFYQHHGVDPYGIVRALVTNVQRGNATGQGASTITQQYIRNTILIDERTHETLERKIREAYLALELEKRHSKREILDMYLNTIYLGEGAYGAESASQVYFAKRAKDLSLPEAALIAGLPQQPSRLNPYENPDGAIERRNQVLAHMLRKHYIDQRAYDTAVATPLDLKRRSEPDDGIYAAPFFVAHVKKLLQQQFSPAVVFKGGLTVYTTVDMKMQGYAESVIKSQLGGKGPEAALVTIDPNTGDVRALYGGSDYSKNKFNLATQGHRQPGSSFKTFVLTTAIEKGMPPYYRIDSASPALIPTKPKPWIVANSEGSGRGMITLASATAASVNTVFARLAWELGAKDIAKTAKRMGIESELPEYPSIALGTRNVTPLEMASAYGTLATGGVHHDPVFITKVVDRDGKVLYTAPTRGSRVLKPEVAYAVTDVLRGVVRSGTGTRANIGRPVAGKTGTSQNYRDVWFVGYTPQLVTSVWAGYRQEQPIYVNGRHAFGGTVCAPIWAAYMRQALAGLPSKDFAKASPPPYDPSKFHIAQSKMADLTNLTLKAAAPKLVGYPFTVEYYYSPKPKDTIIGQTMKKGDLVLRVSKGPAPITVTPTDPNAPADPGTTPSATPTP